MLISYLATRVIVLPFSSLRVRKCTLNGDRFTLVEQSIFAKSLRVLVCIPSLRVHMLATSNFQELIDETDFKVCLTPGSSYADSFQYSNNPLWLQTWKERIEPEIDTYPRGQSTSFILLSEHH